MKSKAISRLESDAERLLEALSGSINRQTQLSAALAKSRDEIEKLRADLDRLKRERTDTRKRVDSLIKRFDSLEINWEQIEA
jgi:predicted nuclease with TOPRIM domain